MDGQPELDGPVDNRPWLLDLPMPEAPVEADDALPLDTLGLALSGGGIRSASFSLGVLQALAKAGWLRHVDFLSTVSGGGYIGSFVGRSFDVLRSRSSDSVPAVSSAPEQVTSWLTAPDSAPIAWLRRHSNYLAPGGTLDAKANVSGFLRNLLAVDLVLGVSLFAIFGVLNALGYSGLITALARQADDLIGGVTPLTQLLPDGWSGASLILSEMALWLAAAPLMIAYWLISQELPEAFIVGVLVAAAIIAAAVTLMTGSALGLIVMTTAVLWTIGSWASSRCEPGPLDPTSPYRMSLPRDELTRWLAVWVVITAILSAFAAVDLIGLWLARQMLDGGLTVEVVSRWLASAATTAVGSVALLRMITLSLESRSDESFLRQTGRRSLGMVLLLLLGLLPPLIAVSFASHLSYVAGQEFLLGLSLAAVAAVVSLLFGSRECLLFINQSGPREIYAGRLSRTFLGAVNPARRHYPNGLDVTRSVAGDDVPMADYRPELAGGPLHLINCAVNETVELASSAAVRDRQAENLAVGPAGMSVSRDWHARWTNDPRPSGGLEPLDEGQASPFRSRYGGPVPVERLSLREWVAISGAAVSPGKGRRTGLASSVILTIVNARLGYWWDSGLDTRERADIPFRGGVITTIKDRLNSLFRTQWLLLLELTGRFGGPWQRHWYLSDGGFFEVTAAYELLRRRVPFVILCDASEDPKHLGSDLARLVRLARVDLGAEIVEVPANEKMRRDLKIIPPGVAERLGSLDDLLTPNGGQSQAHAALLRVTYPDAPPDAGNDPWLQRKQTWLLYLKASCTGDEPVDVRSYAANHPNFPNESTLNQMFDEPQWESYRKLGEHITSPLVAPYEGSIGFPRSIHQNA